MDPKNKFPSLDVYTVELFDILGFLQMAKSINQSSTKKILSNCFVSISFILMIIFWITQFSCIKDIDSVLYLSELAAVFNYTLLGIFKWYHCKSQQNLLEDIIKSLNKCHNLCRNLNKSDKDYKIYHENMVDAKKTSRNFMILWGSINAAGLSQWCIGAFVGDYLHNGHLDLTNENITYTRKFPAIAKVPFDIDTWSKYSYVFIFQTITMIICSIGFATFDVLVASLMMYICAQLNYLNESLIDQKDIDIISRSSNSGEKFLKKIKNCMLHHSKIFRIHEDYEEYASRPMFVHCIESIFNLCMVSISVSTMEYDFSSTDCMLSVTSLIELWMGAAFELFVYCYYGTKIEELSLKVSHSFFSSGWEKINFDNNIKTHKNIHNLLRIGITRAQKPIITTGGPFYNLNLPTFKNLVYISISNGVVLRQTSGY